MSSCSTDSYQFSSSIKKPCQQDNFSQLTKHCYFFCREYLNSPYPIISIFLLPTYISIMYLKVSYLRMLIIYAVTRDVTICGQHVRKRYTHWGWIVRAAQMWDWLDIARNGCQGRPVRELLLEWESPSSFIMKLSYDMVFILWEYILYP